MLCFIFSGNERRTCSWLGSPLCARHCVVIFNGDFLGDVLLCWVNFLGGLCKHIPYVCLFDSLICKSITNTFTNIGISLQSLLHPFLFSLLLYILYIEYSTYLWRFQAGKPLFTLQNVPKLYQYSQYRPQVSSGLYLWLGSRSCFCTSQYRPQFSLGLYIWLGSRSRFCTSQYRPQVSLGLYIWLGSRSCFCTSLEKMSLYLLAASWSAEFFSPDTSKTLIPCLILKFHSQSFENFSWVAMFRSSQNCLAFSVIMRPEIGFPSNLFPVNQL